MGGGEWVMEFRGDKGSGSKDTPFGFYSVVCTFGKLHLGEGPWYLSRPRSPG
jgi:hypothetical protein